jgi:hypothetical protein
MIALPSENNFSIGYATLACSLKKTVASLKVGAVKGAAEENFGAVKGWKRAVILEKSSREGSAGPGNPGGHWLTGKRKKHRIPS